MKVRAALIVAAVAVFPPLLRAQETTLVLGASQLGDAARNNYVFLLSERAFGSRCFSSAGPNNGLGTWARAVSEGLNGYGGSTCRHHGLSPRQLENGWRVSSVSTTQSCQYKNGNTWTALTASQCTFTLRTTPAVGSQLAMFEADVQVRGSAFQDRRATLTWRIELRGPTGTSPWVPQAPSAPALLSPEANRRLTTGSTTFSWSAPATGATSYRLHFCPESGACQMASQVTTTGTANIAVPFRGQRVRWFVQACNTRGCTNSAESRTIINTLPSATLVSPAEAVLAANRRPTFSWQTVAGAQTYELYVYHPNPLQTFRLANLTSAATQFTPATDLTLSSPVYWSVNACTTSTGCGTPANSQQARSLQLPPAASFTADLAPAFNHERCRNCHAVAATSFQRGLGGLPGSHTVVTSATNCAQSNCHTTSLLPAGTVDPGWHAAPATMDFRSKSPAQLCEMAKNRGTLAPSVLLHLTQDRLILWAVGDGRVPGKTLTTASPDGIPGWRARVERWIGAGMPCD